MPKPSEFYVGVLDFFAILLPGAIATAILTPSLGPLVLGPLIPAPTGEADKWVVFPCLCLFHRAHHFPRRFIHRCFLQFSA